MIFAAADAVAGTNLEEVDASQAAARLTNTAVNSAGGLSVEAENTASIDAEISNDATSAASAIVDANGMAAAALIALNRVTGGADTEIDLDIPRSTADGVVLIPPGQLVQDGSAVYRYTGAVDLAATDFTDAGVWTEVLGGLRVYDSAETAVGLRSDDMVRDGNNSYRYTGAVDLSSLTPADFSDYTDSSVYASDATGVNLVTGDLVYIVSGAGANFVYRYDGAGASAVDLSAIDFSVPSDDWAQLQIKAYADLTATEVLQVGDLVIDGGIVRAYGGTNTLDLSVQDYSDRAFWQVLDVTVHATSKALDVSVNGGFLIRDISAAGGGVLIQSDGTTVRMGVGDQLSIDVSTLGLSSAEQAAFVAELTKIGFTNSGTVFSLNNDGTIASTLTFDFSAFTLTRPINTWLQSGSYLSFSGFGTTAALSTPGADGTAVILEAGDLVQVTDGSEFQLVRFTGLNRLDLAPAVQEYLTNTTFCGARRCSGFLRLE